MEVSIDSLAACWRTYQLHLAFKSGFCARRILAAPVCTLDILVVFCGCGEIHRNSALSIWGGHMSTPELPDDPALRKRIVFYAYYNRW